MLQVSQQRIRRSPAGGYRGSNILAVVVAPLREVYGCHLDPVVGLARR